jgi:hypothetical protein
MAQKLALDRVLENLTTAGVNAQLIKRPAVERGTTADRPAGTLWHPPQLVVYANEGRRIATVSVGIRSGSYMVELARTGPDNELRADRVEVVAASMPERVAWLVGQNAGCPRDRD